MLPHTDSCSRGQSSEIFRLETWSQRQLPQRFRVIFVSPSYRKTNSKTAATALAKMFAKYHSILATDVKNLYTKQLQFCSKQAYSK